MSFILEYWKLNRCMVRGQIHDKVRKVGISQISFRGRLDTLLDSDAKMDPITPPGLRYVLTLNKNRPYEDSYILYIKSHFVSLLLFSCKKQACCSHLLMKIWKQLNINWYYIWNMYYIWIINVSSVQNLYLDTSQYRVIIALISFCLYRFFFKTSIMIAVYFDN